LVKTEYTKDLKVREGTIEAEMLGWALSRVQKCADHSYTTIYHVDEDGKYWMVDNKHLWDLLEFWLKFKLPKQDFYNHKALKRIKTKLNI